MNLRDQISHDLWEEEEDVYPMMLMHKFTFTLYLIVAFAVGGLVAPMLISWFVQ